jgi:hypothetical protein
LVKIATFLDIPTHYILILESYYHHLIFLDRLTLFRY